MYFFQVWRLRVGYHGYLRQLSVDSRKEEIMARALLDCMLFFRRTAHSNLRMFISPFIINHKSIMSHFDIIGRSLHRALV